MEEVLNTDVRTRRWLFNSNDKIYLYTNISSQNFFRFKNVIQPFHYFFKVKSYAEKVLDFIFYFLSIKILQKYLLKID